MLRTLLGLVLLVVIAFGTYHKLTTMECNNGDVLCAKTRIQSE